MSASVDPYVPVIGDIVWARMKPWRPWPGEVQKPPKGQVADGKKKIYWIFFYGTNNFGWVDRASVWPFEEFKEKYTHSQKKNDKSFLLAISTAEKKCSEKSATGGKTFSFETEDGEESDSSVKSVSTTASTSKPSSIASTSKSSSIASTSKSSSIASTSRSSSIASTSRSSSTASASRSNIAVQTKTSSCVIQTFKTSALQASSKASAVPSSVEPSRKRSRKAADIASTSRENVTETSISDASSDFDKIRSSLDISSILSTSAGPPRKKKRIIGNSSLDPKTSKLPKVNSEIETNNFDDLQIDRNPMSDNEAFVRALEALQASCYPPRKDLPEAELEKQANAKKPTIGVLGLGRLGGEITILLLHTNHQVKVWNRTESKLAKYLERGAKKGDSPADVFKSCDITLVCVSNSQAVKKITFMNGGLYGVADETRKLVVFTLMDPDDSLDVCDPLQLRGVRYLEAPVCRASGRVPKTDGWELKDDDKSLVILAAGDEQLFHECASVFKAISMSNVFIGPTGTASTAALIKCGFIGSIISGLAEGMALAERIDVDLKVLLEILSVSPLGSPFLLSKAKAMMDKEFPPEMPLEHLETSMRYCLNLASRYNHSMPVASTSHQMCVAAKAMGYGERDMSAVFLPARF